MGEIVEDHFVLFEILLLPNSLKIQVLFFEQCQFDSRFRMLTFRSHAVGCALDVFQRHLEKYNFE